MDLSALRAQQTSVQKSGGVQKVTGDQLKQGNKANLDQSQVRDSDEKGRSTLSAEREKDQFQIAKKLAQKELDIESQKGQITMGNQLTQAAFGLVNKFWG